ncbi:M23 family metallopeptidase [Psychroflexus lacisalsi]|uniref:M23ase beta-sheet core domain-containing protein n=1 Tax=Psychroflexus lacisalsi TaxID=503928 RepID=A0ABN1KC37_9FLAO|nr:M23 family metallopeptidase [Psychroflexus lacisalsi]MBZ9620653.1 M23 family metallopeptidase [Psychroflexus lacisalsi]
MKTIPIKLLLLFSLLTVIFSCEKDDTVINQRSYLKTVGLTDAKSFVRQSLEKKNSSSGDTFITSISDEINYEDLTNTDEELAVIPIKTIYKHLYSRITLLEIDGEVRSVVVSLNPFENATPSSFSGELLITDTEGKFLKGFKIENNLYVAEYVNAYKASNIDANKNHSITKSTVDCDTCPYSECSYCDLGSVDLGIIERTPPPSLYVSISHMYPTGGGVAETSSNEWDLGGSGPGYTDNTPEPEAEKPCPGDPVKNPEIVSSGASGKKGGTFGCTRQGDTDCSPPFDKEHDGMDIKAELDTNVYAMYSGKISNIRDSFSPGQYQIDSYGNYVIITFQINGNTYFAKYNHLNTVSVVQGQSVVAGDIIGTAGNTGNAASAGVTPHIHLQVFNSSWQSINPSDFLNTKYDNNHNPISNCN